MIIDIFFLQVDICRP